MFHEVFKVCSAFLILTLFLLLLTMDKRVEQRTIIKFLVKSGHTPIQCWRQLHQAFGTDTFSKNTVCTWHKTFSQGRDQVRDLARPGRPKSTRTDEAVQQVRDQLQADRRKTVRQMSEDTGINKTTLHTILKRTSPCPKWLRNSYRSYSLMSRSSLGRGCAD